MKLNPARQGEVYNSQVDLSEGQLTTTVSLEDGSPLPEWLNFDPVTKTLTGTPRENDKGPLSLKFTTEQVVYASLEVIENQAPVSSGISDQSCDQGSPFTFVVPRSTFSDTPGDTLVFSATQESGEPLPAWLAFDASTLTFSGTPTGPANLLIKVTATDMLNAEVSSVFALSVRPKAFVEGKHRFQKRRLFQRAKSKTEPCVYVNSLGQTIASPYHDIRYDLVAGANNCHRMVGASADLVCWVTRWPWANKGGDFVDAAGVPQGTQPFATAKVIAASGVLAFEATSIMQQVHTQQTWAALMLRTIGGSGTLNFVGVLNETAAQKPSITIVYTDGVSEVLPLWYTSSTIQSTSYLNAHEDFIPVSINANGLIEFDRPTRIGVPIATAILSIPYTNSNVNLNLGLFLVAPKIPDLTPVKGYAASYQLDAGIAADPRTLVSQLITDQTTIKDVLDTKNSGDYNFRYNPSDPPILSQTQECYFDPTLWGQPPADPKVLPTLLPYRNFGKWVGAAYAEDNVRKYPSFSVVHSDYNKYGFTPLAPGLGAIHLVMPKAQLRNAQGIPTGDVKPGMVMRVDAERGTDVSLWLPRKHIGRVRRIRFRYYVLLGDGWEPRDDAFQHNFLGSVNGKFPEELGYTTVESLKGLEARPSDNGGKMFGGAQHTTSGVVVKAYKYPTRMNAGKVDNTEVTQVLSGGYGATSGGDIGYQGRMMWFGGYHKALGGPAEGGFSVGVELYDFQNGRMPPSQINIFRWDSRYESMFAYNGGIGHLYKDGRWRCIELEWKLNDNAPYTLPPPGTNFNESGFANPPTGYLRAWIDGVLASSTPNFGFTRLPKIDWALQEAAGYPFDKNPGSPALFRPITNVTDEEYLGFASIAGNLYYGGRSPCPVDRHLFINGIVAAQENDYIGPMSGVSRENGGLD